MPMSRNFEGVYDNAIHETVKAAFNFHQIFGKHRILCLKMFYHFTARVSTAAYSLIMQLDSHVRCFLIKV